ncbi:MAG TPA: hypothetical protein VKY92_21965 [Verrucomicrobiae bacterium]|nr:hypothetical protein [Verrucomicrobiae bacterium]
MNGITNLTPQQLREAADLQQRILDLQNELQQLLGGSSSTPSVTTTSRGGRRLSPEGLARIREAARRRWARERATNGASASSKPRRKMSAAGRARIAAMLRARWAAAKKAGRNAL